MNLTPLNFKNTSQDISIIIFLKKPFLLMRMELYTELSLGLKKAKTKLKKIKRILEMLTKTFTWSIKSMKCMKEFLSFFRKLTVLT